MVAILAPFALKPRRMALATYLGTFFPKRNVGDADIRQVYCGFFSKSVNNRV